MKVRAIIIGMLLCSSFSTFILNAQNKDEQLNAFRSAKRIKIVSRQSLDETIDYNDISFVDVTKRLLEEYCKCKIVGPNNKKFDLILDLDIEVISGRIKSKSGRKITIRQTLELSGNISLEVPDKPIYKKSFYGREFGYSFKSAYTTTGSFLNTILEIIGEVWGTEAIISCLKDKDIYVVMRATDILGKMKDPIAVQPLINAFMVTRKYDRDGQHYSKEYIRSFMIMALGEIGDERAAPYFMTYIKNCGGSRMTERAATALEKSGALWTVKPLLFASERWGSGGKVNEIVMDALVRMGESIVDTLIDILKQNETPRITRARIIRLLGVIGDIRAVEPLTTLLSNNYDEYFKKDIVNALGALGDLRAVKPLIAILDTGTASYKGDVIRSLGNLGDSTAVDLLIENFLEDNQFSVWFWKDKYFGESHPTIYYVAFARIGSKKAIDFLFRIYNDLDVFNQESKVLSNFKYVTKPNAIKYIIALLMDKKCPDRAVAARFLGELNDTTVVKPLISVFSDEESPYEIRIEAYNSLIIKINTNMALKYILTVLENTESNNMMMYLISELGSITDVEAIKPLMSIFKDKKSPEAIRIESAKSLVKIDNNKKKDPFIVESLIKIALTALKNKNYDHFQDIVYTFREWKSGSDLELRKRLPKVTIKGQLIGRKSRKPYKNDHLFFGELTENGDCIFYGDYTAKTDTNGFFILKNVPMPVGEHTVAISDKIVDVSFVLKIIDQNAFNTSTSYGNYEAGRLKDGVISISHIGLDFSLTFSIQNFDLLKFEIPSRKQTELKLEF